jgi:hypothetical protein
MLQNQQNEVVKMFAESYFFQQNGVSKDVIFCLFLRYTIIIYSIYELSLVVSFGRFSFLGQ